MRKLLIVMAVGIFAAIGSAAGTQAFEPPRDPADVFSCPGGNPVAGHPGAPGLLGIVSEERLGPWNAVFAPNTPLTLC